jgi:uncharacterized protein YndB with AHSA1/START domain
MEVLPRMDITKSYVIAASPSEVWRALTEAESIEGWGGGPAVMRSEAGSPFSLWGGDIWGTNVQVVPERCLVQEWYGGEWPAPSIVTFTLTPERGGTLVELLHRRVPDDEAVEFEAGWDDYYLGAIKEYLEV